MKRIKCWMCDGKGYHKLKKDDKINIHEYTDWGWQERILTREQHEMELSKCVMTGSFVMSGDKIDCEYCNGDGWLLSLEDGDLK